MTIDGRIIAGEVYTRLIARRGTLPTNLSLGIVCCEPDAVIESFVRIKSRAAEKLGVTMIRRDVPANAGEEGIIAAIDELARETQGVIVQLPLPQGMDTERVLAAIPHEKDVDGLAPDSPVVPPVARAVREILMREEIAVSGMRAIVVGAGRLVGAPCAQMLESEGARVQVITKEHGSLEELRDADIIVSGAGEPGFITPDMIREGVVLIDAGTSEQGGKVRGDADLTCASKCRVFTPVPGGVGPIAVAMIFENLFALGSK